jgi:hypothetical protein
MRNEGRGLEVGTWCLAVKQIAFVLGLVFAITLAVMVGKEMSTEAMAVVIGIVCGVAAGIPTAVLLLVVLTRKERQRMEGAGLGAQRGACPPIVVIQGGAPQVLPYGTQGGTWPMPSTGPIVNRQFHIVGGEDLGLNG